MGLVLFALFGTLLPARFASDNEVASFKELRELSESHVAQKRRSAVRQLALLDTPEAWELVIAGLGDSEGLVADEAEWRLGEENLEPLGKELLGRAGLRSVDSLVAVRVASLLGRMRGDVDCEVFSRALKSRDFELQLSLLDSLETCALQNRLVGKRGRAFKAALNSYRSAREPRARASALVAAARVADVPKEREDLERELERGVREREPCLRVAALVASSSCTDSVVSALLARLAEDPEMSVRLQVVESAKQLANRTSANMLVRLLEHETHPRARWLIVAALQRLSGLRHRADVRPWRDWASKLPEGWSGSRESKRRASEPVSSASLAGLPILSDRIAFLVDFSGSLWSRRPGGTMRKEYAEAELRNALESLPDTAYFNLIPFTSEPHPWKPALVRATKRNVKAALTWFEECEERGTGDFFEAAQVALKDPKVDTILSFTDGLPTGGPRCRLDLMVPELLKRARFRRVAFDTLLVDAPDRLHRHWQRLADESGGQMHTAPDS